MNIISLYFAVWLVVDLGYKDIYYSIAFSASMLLAAVLMPALGCLSDGNGRPDAHRDKPGFLSQRRLLFLLIFTAGSVLSVAIFALLPKSAIILVLILFSLSNFFYEGGMVFYNAMLRAVSNENNVGEVSGFGVALGYMGSIVGMVLVLPFVTGKLFGWDIPFIEGGGRSAAFLPTALFFALFSVPIFLFVREKPLTSVAFDVAPNRPRSLGGAYRDIWQSLEATKKYPGLLDFLIADFFFEDAIASVIIFMAVFTNRILGWDSTQMSIFLIVSTLSAMLGAYPLGWLADRLSPKKVLSAVVLGWIIVLVMFSLNRGAAMFWILGPIVGLLLGGVWATSRPLLMRLSPPEKLGEFFGLFSLSGRSAAICGPLVWGTVVYFFSPDKLIGQITAKYLTLSARQIIPSFVLSQKGAAELPYRLAILSLAALVAVGFLILEEVPDTKKFDELRSDH